MAAKQKDPSPPSTTNQTPLPEAVTPPTNQIPSSGTATAHPSHAGGIHQRHISSARLCITRQQKLALKLIEKKSNELQEEEYRLEKDGNHVIILLACMLLLYVLVFGAGIVINREPIAAYITSNKNENTLIITIVATVCTCVAGIGMHVFLAFQNIQRLSWKNTIIQQQRENLKAESEAFRRELNIVSVGLGIEVGGSSGVINISVDTSRVTLESANTRIKACIDSLGSDYFYHGHMFYVISTGVIGAVFLGIIVTLLVFSYTQHKDSDLSVKLGQPSFSSLI